MFQFLSRVLLVLLLIMYNIISVISSVLLTMYRLGYMTIL